MKGPFETGEIAKWNQLSVSTGVEVGSAVGAVGAVSGAGCSQPSPPEAADMARGVPILKYPEKKEAKSN